MKHKASRDLYAYWNTLRGDRSAPGRNEIEPGAIRGALGDTIMLTREHGKNANSDATFRLAGTRVCALFCRELKNSAFQPLFDDNSRAELDELMDVTTEDSIGFIAGLSAKIADHPDVQLELLLLPLLQLGVTDSRMIGVLAPATPPAWLGVHPLQSLTLNSWRYVSPQLDATIVPKFFDLPEDDAAPDVVPIEEPTAVAGLPSGASRAFMVLSGGRD
jgi:hypothetical protein